MMEFRIHPCSRSTEKLVIEVVKNGQLIATITEADPPSAGIRVISRYELHTKRLQHAALTGVDIIDVKLEEL
jgi:hypothetical protein